MPKTPLKCVQTWFVEHVTPCVLAVTLKPKNTLRLLLLKKKKKVVLFLWGIGFVVLLTSKC